MNLNQILAGKPKSDMTFDQKVWTLTARIPRGKVTTYGRIAKALRSQGARAVGGALNRNPYAPRVPCHRVVGSDGRLTGYAGGLSKKKWMLAAEGVELKGERVDLKLDPAYPLPPRLERIPVPI